MHRHCHTEMYSTIKLEMKNVKEAKSIANDVKPNFKQAEQLIEEAMNCLLYTSRCV